jgi:hypothetical protein
MARTSLERLGALDFKPDCRSCLYVSMVLQRPVACERHAGAAGWPAGPESGVERLLDPLAELGSRQVDDLARNDGTVRVWSTANPRAAFSRDEYSRLTALRVRVREHLRRGCHPDHLIGPADSSYDVDGPLP